MLEVGTPAPDFALPDQQGNIHRLSDYRGKKVILYFYPKDNTPGCSKQACGYSDNIGLFTDKNVTVLGISRDSVNSHLKFAEKFGLNFTILSDPELSAISGYDVWKEKKQYGRSYMGVVRTTYLIDESGIIIMANDKVKAADDYAKMLELIK
ncbi:MAG: thioredoxin-dependent thiol peroxidase [Ruminobacter sp.]|uniref:thioredoxin-dependent thiol peroxidase n=1 Tax=Ruminobacter sp. TaxID=2774296 RepID=UPI001B4EAB03|nr:thioredoxin-dependent thiol peroxidase [Ruminobacter sp.]MBP3748242.1 thioredoxin-dependent thiol peroxidase [Ruminobacter sp.]